MNGYHVVVAKNSRYEIELQALACGGDYQVAICGGTRHHIGAVSLGCAKDADSPLPGNQATVSTICAFGHRDDELSRWAARYLATRLCCTVSVSAGVHINNASADEIQTLTAHCEEACRIFISQILTQGEKKKCE